MQRQGAALNQNVSQSQLSTNNASGFNGLNNIGSVSHANNFNNLNSNISTQPSIIVGENTQPNAASNKTYYARAQLATRNQTDNRANLEMLKARLISNNRANNQITNNDHKNLDRNEGSRRQS